MEGALAGLLGLVALLTLVALGMPIAFALGLAGFIGLLLLLPTGAALASLFTLPWGFPSYTLSVVALFVLTGHLAFVSGVAKDAYEVGYKLVGRLPGGLAVATVYGAASFAATTGSSVACAATVGRLAIPEMERYGYDRRLATGCVAAAGTLGVLIPPSVLIVIYGVLAEESIGRLLMAGIIPGIVSAALYGVMIITRAKLNPRLAPPVAATPWKQALCSVPKMWGVVLLFVTMLGGIYLGVFTPTEAGAVGALIACVLVLLRVRSSRVGAFKEAFGDTARVVGMIFSILIGASLFAAFIALTRLPFWFAEMVGAMEAAPLLILSLVLFLYIPLGMFLDPIPIMVITLPVVLPTVVNLGYDLIWFGIIIVKMMEISLITPPVGLNVYVVKSVAPHVPLEDIFRGIGWFLVVDVFTVALLIAFPGIVTWLPQTMFR